MNSNADNYGNEYFVKAEFDEELGDPIDILKPKEKLECHSIIKCEGCPICKPNYKDMNV